MGSLAGEHSGVAVTPEPLRPPQPANNGTHSCTPRASLQLGTGASPEASMVSVPWGWQREGRIQP